MATYWAVRWWLEDEYETFQDIEDAWNLGLAELQRHQLDIRDRGIPVYLVLGVENSARIERLFQAAQLGQLPIFGYPPHKAALHWYASYRAIFVVCSEVGCLSYIARRAGAELGEVSLPDVTLPAVELNRTFWPSEQPNLEEPDAQPGPPPLLGAGLPQGVDLGKTLLVHNVDEYLKKRNEGGVALRKDVTLHPEQRDVQLARLGHVCRLLTNARKPIEPINGLVILYPINLILCDASDGSSIQTTTHDDVQTIVEWLHLRCPAYAVVTDWEDDTGFQEMIRRLGPAIVQRYRFGKGAVNTCDVPRKSTIGKINEWACRAFEDWIYRLFAEPEALQKPGNRSLYHLLCKIRRYLRPRMERILVGGFATSNEEYPYDVPFFAGCYFVATGKQPGHQAFTPALFKRIIDEREKVEWTDEAIDTDHRSHRKANILFLCAFILFLIFIVFVSLPFF